MQQRAIGEVQVSVIGLGGMPMSIEGRPERERSIATIHAAIDAGITLIDTADAYNRDANETGHNESLIAEALASYGPGAANVLVATKGGLIRPGDGSWNRNGDPEYIKGACKESIRRLGVEAIGLYQMHRHDPHVPYEDTMGAFAELLDEGLVRMVGVSNATVEMIETAQRVMGGRVVSVQNQFSPGRTDDYEVMQYCAANGLTYLPWSPLDGIRGAGALGSRHEAFAEVGADHGVSAQQVALAWEIALAPVVIPIPGASRPETIRDSAEAGDLELTDVEIQRLSAVLPA